MRARAARPVRYVHRKTVQGSYAARTMRWGGVIILLFVIYHILDLTTGHGEPAAATPSNPYDNVVADFAPDAGTSRSSTSWRSSRSASTCGTAS